MKIYHTATREDYDALMIELDSQGYKWLSGAKMQKFDAFGMYREKAYEAHKDKTVLHTTLVGKDDVIEYKAKGSSVIEEQLKKRSQELTDHISDTMGTLKYRLDFADEYLEKTQKLVKEFDDTLTEFIDSRKLKFEVGDYITNVTSDNERTFIGVVSVINLDMHDGYFYYRERNELLRIIVRTGAGVVRLSTPEEIAEYEAALTFYKHGRKPFEVKQGDILRDDKGNIFFADFPSIRNKEYFTSGDYTFLKTAEEVNEWLGADDERLNSSKETA